MKFRRLNAEPHAAIPRTLNVFDNVDGFIGDNAEPNNEQDEEARQKLRSDNEEPRNA